MLGFFVVGDALYPMGYNTGHIIIGLITFFKLFEKISHPIITQKVPDKHLVKRMKCFHVKFTYIWFIPKSHKLRPVSLVFGWIK